MSIMILMPNRPEGTRLASHLLELNPQLEIQLWPEETRREAVETLVVWNHPEGSLGEFPNLRLVHSFGAGVESILSDPSLPSRAAVCRVVEPELSRQMAEFLLCTVLNHRFNMRGYWHQQSQRLWSPLARNSGNTLGLLGLGALGSAVAAAFVAHGGFRVLGWNRRGGNPPGVECFTGGEGLKRLASQSDYLCCLLPLTPVTRGILNRELFEVMQPQAYLINVGRGAHLNEADLVSALEQGQIAGAALDVVSSEPLGQESDLWQTQGISITPHIASLSDPRAVAQQVYENHCRSVAGRSLINQSDPLIGY